MADPITLLGVVSAGLQCASTATKLFSLALSLRSKLQDAPEKVKKRLGQIDQLIALAAWMRQTEAYLSSSSSSQLPQSLSSSGQSRVRLVEAALLDCTNQAQVLQRILKDMIQDADDGKLRNMWKGILSVKREQDISSALDEIERQKALLIIWLGLSNSQQFYQLHGTFDDICERLKDSDQRIVHFGQTFRDEFCNLSTEVRDHSSTNTSRFEDLRSLSISNTNSLRQQMQDHHLDIQSNSSLMQLQLRDIVSIPNLTD